MNRTIFLFALAVGAATPAVAAPSGNAALRNAKNWDVLLSQYPPRALAAGEQGPVGFRVTLDNEGYASACEVTRSSGYSRLDNETCQMLVNRATFKGVKDANGRKASSVHEGVINWMLPTITAGSAAPVKMAQSNAKPEKMICKRQLRTGSLVDYQRNCATKSDWQRAADRARERWRDSPNSSRGVE